MTLREITRRPKKALARRSDIDDEPVVQVQRPDTRMESGLFVVLKDIAQKYSVSYCSYKAKTQIYGYLDG